MAAKPEQALQVMRRASQGMLEPEVAAAVVSSARSSIGLPLIAGEQQMLQELCSRALTTLASYQKAVRRLRALSKAGPSGAHDGTDGWKGHGRGAGARPRQPGAVWQRAGLPEGGGLNLREKSSGKYQGQLKLTKRGPGRARRYLWLAALRLLQRDGVVRAYYAQKVARSGGRKSPAVVAVMRKLMKGLYACVRNGQGLDSSKLFDVSRLAAS